MVGFPELGDSLAVGDDALRSALAGRSPRGRRGDDGHARPEPHRRDGAPGGRIAALPPGAVVGLWTLTAPRAPSPSRPDRSARDLGGQPRSAVLAGCARRPGTHRKRAVSFTTLRLVYGDAVAGYLPGQPNSVLVVTSGPHTDRTLDGPGLRTMSAPRSIGAAGRDQRHRHRRRPGSADLGIGGSDHRRRISEPARRRLPELISAVGRLLG